MTDVERAENPVEADFAGSSRQYPWWSHGDTSAFFALFSDNLATVVALTIGLLGPVGVPPGTVFGKILPGVGLSIIVGNIFYAYQAKQLAARTGRTDVTAQPYGINTPGAFMFLYTLMLKVVADETADGASRAEAGEEAYRVAALANIVSGLIEMAGAVLGPVMERHIPFPALMAPLAGVAFTYLALNHLRDVLAPGPGYVGLAALFITLWGYLGGCFKLGKSGINPTAWVAVALATVIAWSSQVKTREEIETAWDYMSDDRWGVFMGFPLADVSEKTWRHLGKVMSIVVPVSVTNFMATMQVCKSAAVAGDEYSTVTTMLADGAGTVIGGLFGSTFGSTVYIGHPVYKKMNGKMGYSLANGAVMWIICFTGMCSLVVAIISKAGLNCMIVLVGVALCAQVMEETPPHQYPTLLLGIFPHLAEWALTLVGNDRFGCTMPDRPSDAVKYPALYSLGQGAMLNSLGLSVICYFGLDRRFLAAGVSAFVMAMLSMVGGVHDSELREPKNDIDTQQWSWCLAHLSVAGVCGIMYGLNRAGMLIRDPRKKDEITGEYLDDESDGEGGVGASTHPPHFYHETASTNPGPKDVELTPSAAAKEADSEDVQY